VSLLKSNSRALRARAKIRGGVVGYRARSKEGALRPRRPLRLPLLLDFPRRGDLMLSQLRELYVFDVYRRTGNGDYSRELPFVIHRQYKEQSCPPDDFDTLSGNRDIHGATSADLQAQMSTEQGWGGERPVEASTDHA
jgi:hypothetical protein